MSKVSLLVRLAALLTDLAKLSHAKRDYSGFAAPDLSGLGWLSTGQRWGTEAPRIDVCPSGENGGADTFVSGYQVKVDPVRHRGDSSAVNGVRFFCSALNGSLDDAVSIESLVGLAGEWRPPVWCGDGEFVHGGRMLGDLNTGLLHDDLSAAYVDFYCGFKPEEEDGDFGIDRGTGLVARRNMIRLYQMHCQPFSRACGLKTTVNFDTGPIVDDVGLTNIKLLCCPFGSK